MVNVSKLVAWFYNLFFNADDKRKKLKARSHYLVYQNKSENDYTNKEKAKINYLQEKAEEYQLMVQQINCKYQEYLHEKFGGVNE